MTSPACSRTAIRFVALSLGVLAIGGLVTSLPAAQSHHSVVPADAVKWGAAPPSLPPGAQASVLLGSPAQEGPFVLRLKLPVGYVIPPHRHSKDELVTVIAGQFDVGAGEKLDRAAFQSLPPASFVYLPAG